MTGADAFSRVADQRGFRSIGVNLYHFSGQAVLSGSQATCMIAEIGKTNTTLYLKARSVSWATDEAPPPRRAMATKTASQLHRLREVSSRGNSLVKELR